MPKMAEQVYRARFARSRDDVKAAQRLRQRCFAGLAGEALDQDRYDQLCRHLLVEEHATGRLVCCCRVMRFDTGADIQTSYSAQFYDLSGLQAHSVPMLEIGRFCIDPQTSGADVLRTTWGALTLYVDQQKARVLFGCSSFSGTDTRPYLDAFALLSRQYLAPKYLRPNVKAPDVVRFVAPPCKISDEKQAWASLPPLLRSYLAMGGWVSDHAVVDENMNSLHVFTGLDISAIPPARARLLRAVAKSPAVALRA